PRLQFAGRLHSFHPTRRATLPRNALPRPGRRARRPGDERARLRLETLECRLVPTPHPAPAIDLSGLVTHTTARDPSHPPVQFRSDADRAAFQASGMSVGAALPLVPNLYEVNLTGPWTVSGAVAALAGNAAVLSAQPDYVVRAEMTPNDTSFGNQWDFKNTGQY